MDLQMTLLCVWWFWALVYIPLLSSSSLTHLEMKTASKDFKIYIILNTHSTKLNTKYQNAL